MSTTALPAIAATHSGAHIRSLPTARRVRTITPREGRAIEILAHAIEYLTDEYVNDRGFLNPSDLRMDAVQLLMRLNREVYFQCPITPTLSERCRTLMSRMFHLAHTN